MLLGPRHALLRPEFADARRTLRERDGTVRRLLVFVSGADEADVTGRAAEAAATTGLPADVVIGSAYPSADRLRRWAAGHPGIRLHVNTPHMAELMAAADLAVGAPSSASWERCALGLPSILVVLADNQAEIGTLLDAAGAGISLGWHHEVTTDRIANAIRELASDATRVRAMSDAAAGVTDGLGATRVADALERLVAGRPGGRIQEAAP
jgi:UDP-2,4-diacetamido-2,4,6-trideoxy-beta-L-altropyranose hydrolase